MTSSDKHRKRQREAMEEVDDRNMRVRLQNFIHKAFPHYKRQVRVESISRMSGKKVERVLRELVWEECGLLP